MDELGRGTGQDPDHRTGEETGLAFGYVQPAGLTLSHGSHQLQLVWGERRCGGGRVPGEVRPDVLEHGMRRTPRGLGHECLPEAAGEAQDHRSEHGQDFGAPEAEELIIR